MADSDLPAGTLATLVRSGGSGSDVPLVIGLEVYPDSLDTFGSFFRALPDVHADVSNVAFVVVPHLPPGQECVLDEILAASVSLPVIRMAESVQVQPGHVYVLPSNNTLLCQVAGQSGSIRLLLDQQASAEAASPSRPAAPAPPSDLTRAERELWKTREQLHRLIEQHTASQEELMAQNEALQMTNAELRTMTEELEMRREEAQGATRKLQAVNTELTKKVEELTRAKSDLENLMASSEVATLFLDRQLRIQRFTPRVRDLFRLSASDLGRPLSDLARRFGDESLLSQANAVLATLAPKACEVQSDAGRWYLTRLRPYRTIDDRIEGIVLTFTDFTKQKRTAQKLREAKKYAEMMVNAVPDPLLVLTPDFRVKTANDVFYDHFQGTPATTEGHPFFDLRDGQWDRPAWRHLLERVLPEHDTFTNHLVEHHFEHLGLRKMLVSGCRLDAAQLLLLTIKDITEQLRAQARVSELQERFLDLVQSIDAIVFEGDHRDWRFTFVSQAAEAILGYPVERWYEPDFWITRIVHPDDRRWVAETIQKKVAQRQNHDLEFRAVRADGAVVWLRGLLRLVLDEDEVREVRGVMVEITQRKQAEAQLRDLNETLEERVREQTDQVRTLATSLTLAEQRERQRIAQILHDDLQQILYGLDMTLNMLRHPRSADEESTLRDQADETLSLAIETTRSLSVQLSPPVLKNGDLHQLLHWISIRKQEMHDLEVDVRMLTPCHVSNAEVLVLIYQFLRELLFNVVKHAGTNHATVTARKEEEEVIIEVEDDGRGFDPEAVLNRQNQVGGFGLASIWERVELVGGRLTIDAAPGSGTRVVIAVPTHANAR